MPCALPYSIKMEQVACQTHGGKRKPVNRLLFGVSKTATGLRWLWRFLSDVWRARLTCLSGWFCLLFAGPTLAGAIVTAFDGARLVPFQVAARQQRKHQDEPDAHQDGRQVVGQPVHTSPPFITLWIVPHPCAFNGAPAMHALPHCVRQAAFALFPFFCAFRPKGAAHLRKNRYTP